MQTIYIVTSNRKISQEAYHTFEEACEFILTRLPKTPLTTLEWLKETIINQKISHNGYEYQIHPVTVKESK